MEILFLTEKKEIKIMYGKIFLTAAVIFSGTIFAESGFFFLRTEKSAKEISTAQTSYLFSSSIENAGLNPGSVIGDDIFSASVSYKTIFDNADASRFSISYREDNIQYGLVFSALNISGIEGRDVPSEEPLYEFDSRVLTAEFNYAYQFKSNLKLGVSGKYLFEKIEFEDSYGFAGSAGLYRENNFIKDLNLGIAVNNIGSMNKLADEETILPSDVLFGIGYIYRSKFDIDFKIGNSVRYLMEDKDIENFTGAEISYQSRFFIRSGYRADNEGTPYSMGIGVVVDKFSFDYAFTPFSDEEGDSSHAMTLSYTFR